MKKKSARRPIEPNRLRPILPRTTVDPATLAAIRADPRAAGRVIDEAVACWLERRAI